jgi:hypothetical protein
MSILDKYKETLSNCPNNSCGAGINNYGTTARYDNDDASIIVCSCPKCSTTWYICRYCKGSYMYVLLDKAAVLSHNKRLHRDHLPKAIGNCSKRKRKYPPITNNSVPSTIAGITASKI